MDTGRSQPLDTGFYLRCIPATTRVLMYAHRALEPSVSPNASSDVEDQSARLALPTAVVRLQTVVAKALADHEIDKVIIYVRVSPNPDEGERRSGDAQIVPSLEPQVAFLQTVLPVGVHCEVFRDRYTSATSGA